MPARISMIRKQRDAILALPDTEAEVLRLYTLSADDLAAVNQCRSRETRLSYALQLCCLRLPGRYLRRGELLPAVMLDHIAEQVKANAEVIALFARRGATRYEQLADQAAPRLPRLDQAIAARTCCLGTRGSRRLDRSPCASRSADRADAGWKDHHPRYQRRRTFSRHGDAFC